MWLENGKKEAADTEEQQILSENLQTFNLIMKLLVFLKASQPKGQDPIWVQAIYSLRSFIDAPQERVINLVLVYFTNSLSSDIVWEYGKLLSSNSSWNDLLFLSLCFLKQEDPLSFSCILSVQCDI